MRKKSTHFGRRGVALVVILGFLVLLAILVVLFISTMSLDRLSTHGYSQSVMAQELAKGALEELVEDLRMEMRAGSVQDDRLAEGLLLPSNAATIRPFRIGFAPEDFASDVDKVKLPPTVLRVSRAETDFFNNPPAGYVRELLPVNRASAAPSNAPGPDGRHFSAERWNVPLLMGITVPETFSEKPPDWVYLTRMGSRKLSDGDAAGLRSNRNMASGDQVLGRYSYVIYDAGGLLDINAAGFLSTLGSDQEGLLQIGGKTAIAYADLGALPGLPGMSTELDKFITWRSRGSMGQFPDFPELVHENRRLGFLEARAGDSPLLSRQDLIDCFQARFNDKAPLAYLGTFSRAATAPAWGPSANSDELPEYYDSEGIAPQASKVREYRDSALDANPVNPLIPNIRHAASAKIVHYRDDGTIEPFSPEEDTYSYEVQAGDSAVQRRFSLAKLAWLGRDGPNAGAFAASVDVTDREKAIYDCFGLTWSTSGAFPRWIYNHGDPENILTLKEVVEEQAREPDFFELLKAGILNGPGISDFDTGSLGKSPGRTIDSQSLGSHNDANKTGVTAQLFNEHPTTDPDFHVLQIGANIIDQADEDSFPTAIYFHYPGNKAAYSAIEQEYFFSVYGIENLPYMLRMWNPCVVLNERNVNGWYGFELWNPHFPKENTLPRKLRIEAYGIATTTWAGGSAEKASGLFSPEINYAGDEGAQVRHLVFRDNGQFLNKPRRIILEDLVTEETGARNYWREGVGFPSAFPNTLAGIWAGEVVSEDSTIEEWLRTFKNAPSKFFNPRSVIIEPLTFVLQYEDEQGNWRPASIMARQWGFLRNSHTAFTNDGATTGGVHGSTVGRATNSRAGDPRTDRFATFHAENDQWAAESAANFQKPSSARHFSRAVPSPKFGFYFAQDNSFENIAAIRLLSYNTPTETIPGFNGGNNRGFYTDPDGVVRPADGFRQLFPGDDGSIFKGATSIEDQKHSRRPVVLDRPFRSVGELGVVFRDLPFKSLDFWSRNSADAGLLDLFSVTDEPSVVAGLVNPNAAPAPVLRALLRGGAKHPLNGDLPSISGSEAQMIAETLAAKFRDQPVANRAELVTAGSTGPGPYLTDDLNAALPNAFRANKVQAESVVRTLGNLSDFRTWNLMIDVVAQTGRLPKNANALGDFVVQGEKRYWLHIAIDRLSGEVLDKQIEAVYE